MDSQKDDQENDFRQRYSAVLRNLSDKQLDDERYQIKQQAMKTPGRRGEQIKHEEIDKELVRRDKMRVGKTLPP